MRQMLAVCLLLLCVAASPPRVEVKPVEDTAAVLHNPDMGWVLYENYAIDPRQVGLSTMLSLPNEKFDGVDAVALMFAWSDVEKHADDYDFSKVDRAYDYWKSQGKQIQLRMSTESLLWWNNLKPPSGLGVPQYVLDRLPAAAKQVRADSGINYTVVDARERYYIERLTKFLDALNRHFDKQRPVTLVDLRGFGKWGEWHSGFQYPSLADRRTALCGILDCYSKAFPDRWLALSYSHDPDGPAAYYEGPTDHFDPASTKSYDDYVKYSAFDYAMTKPNITLRRDGVGGAVSSNQRKLCDEAFATLAKGPMMCEFITWYAEAKKGDKNWMPFLVNDALSLHANYINLLGYQCADSLNFLKEQPELIANGLRNMGYRLLPTSVTFPASIRAGEEFEIDASWVNRGVGRAMRDFRLRLSVDDQAYDAGTLPTSKWIRGKSYETVSHVSLKSVAPGKHVLRIALIDPSDGSTIALPITSNELGTIEVTDR